MYSHIHSAIIRAFVIVILVLLWYVRLMGFHQIILLHIWAMHSKQNLTPMDTTQCNVPHALTYWGRDKWLPFHRRYADIYIRHSVSKSVLTVCAGRPLGKIMNNYRHAFLWYLIVHPRPNFECVITFHICVNVITYVWYTLDYGDALNDLS